jgi:hypothetical protein
MAHYTYFLFPLWLYSQILGLGRLHENFRFISFTRSRTVGRTPWIGDQLVARPLLTAPGDCDDGELGGMNVFGRGNRSTRRKSASPPLCPPQIPTGQTRVRIRAATVGSQRLTASAMARPITYTYLFQCSCCCCSMKYRIKFLHVNLSEFYILLTDWRKILNWIWL